MEDTNTQLSSSLAEPLAPALSSDRVLVSWFTPEFINHARGKLWFLIAGLLTLGIIAYAVLTGSVTTAVVFLLLAGVYFLTHSQNPRMITIEVTELGIWVHKTFYPYNTIKAFWVVYNPPFVRTLNLQLAKKTMAHVVIQLNQQDPIPLHDTLSRKVPEIEGVQESFVDMCIRMLRL